MGHVYLTRMGTVDLALCFHCKTWISPAMEWTRRSNNEWPGNDLKQSIMTHGVLFVPVGVKGSPKENIEWRISFPVGETLLIHSLKHTQMVLCTLRNSVETCNSLLP